MSGDAEARYRLTHLTQHQRDEMILALLRKGYTQTRIARAAGMTQQGVSYALQRLRGIPRRRSDTDRIEDYDDDYRQLMEF